MRFLELYLFERIHWLQVRNGLFVVENFTLQAIRTQRPFFLRAGRGVNVQPAGPGLDILQPLRAVESRLALAVLLHKDHLCLHRSLCLLLLLLRLIQFRDVSALARDGSEPLGHAQILLIQLLLLLLLFQVLHDQKLLLLVLEDFIRNALLRDARFQIAIRAFAVRGVGLKLGDC